MLRSVVDQVFEFLAGLEIGNAFGGHFHFFAGLRIPADAGISLADPETAEAANFELVAGSSAP